MTACFTMYWKLDMLHYGRIYLKLLHINTFHFKQYFVEIKTTNKKSVIYGKKGTYLLGDKFTVIKAG